MARLKVAAALAIALSCAAVARSAARAAASISTAVRNSRISITLLSDPSPSGSIA